jgi:hypothetical protein
MSLQTEPELERVTVKAQLTRGLDDLNADQLCLGENVLTWPGGAVEVELPERSRTYSDQRHDFVTARKADLATFA